MSSGLETLGPPVGLRRNFEHLFDVIHKLNSLLWQENDIGDDDAISDIDLFLKNGGFGNMVRLSLSGRKSSLDVHDEPCSDF
jgi:hypothetical protein